MNLTQVEYFLEAAKCLNFTAAARTLYVSQPALSKQIALLEKELGVPLFYRENRRVELTEAGICLAGELQTIMQQLEEAKLHAVLAGKKTVSLVRIACFDGEYTDDFLPQLIKVIHCNYSDCQIELMRGTPAEVRRLYEEDQADLLITLGPDASVMPSGHQQVLARRQNALLYADGFGPAGKEPLQLSDFDGLPIICFSNEQSRTGQLHTSRILHKLNLHPGKIIEVADIMTMKTYLNLGAGFAILGEQFEQYNPRIRRMVLPVETGGVMPIVALWKHSPSLVEDILQQYARET